MQKKNIAFQMVIAISLLSLTFSVNESFAQEVDPQQTLEIRADAVDTNYQVAVSGGQIFNGPNADSNDNVSLPDRTSVDGFVSTSDVDDWLFTGTVTITADHHVFTYIDGIEVPNDSPAIEPPTINKVLVIDGDITTSGKTSYSVQVTGEIMLGPDANSHDQISSDGTTLNGLVWPTGRDSFFYTGEIVSITASQNIVAVADGVTQASSSALQLLEIIGDPASENTVYQVVVTGQIMPGPDANASDRITSDGTTVNGYVWTVGKDSFYFTGSIVSITSDHNIITNVS